MFRYTNAVSSFVFCLLVVLFIVEGLYEAVGEYKAVNQDELSIKQGDTVQVINRCMDGWWEIRYNLCK